MVCDVCCGPCYFSVTFPFQFFPTTPTNPTPPPFTPQDVELGDDVNMEEVASKLDGYRCAPLQHHPSQHALSAWHLVRRSGRSAC